MFESEAISFENREKLQTSKEKEAKRLERLKRKQRKLRDKIQALEQDERLKKKRLRLKLQDRQDEDMLEFNDSVRDSLLSYFEQKQKRVDTPTRLLNRSNDFLPLDSIEINMIPKNTNEEPILTPRREMM